MRVRFTSTQNGERWPSIRGDRVAGFGEAVFGPLGFVSFLETACGLVGPPTARAERLARWLPALQARDALWSQPFRTTSWPWCAMLLNWRDEFSLHGWHPGSTPRRLADLAAVDGPVSDGLPDRRRAIVERLRERVGPAQVGTVELVGPEDELPLLWRRVVEVLRAGGSVITQFVGGAASITLIEGDKLIDLLIEHGIGIRMRTVDVLAVDLAVFAELEREA